MIRTDLALEAHESCDIKETRDIDVREENTDGMKITTVDILNENGEKQIGKEKGTYITIEAEDMKFCEDSGREKISSAVGERLKAFLENEKVSGNVLVVGLGNRKITPDALGPSVISKIEVTRHLFEYMPKALIKGARSVSAVAPDVLGNTGIETLEIIRGIKDRTKPEAIIAIDALAAGNPSRVGNTVQISNTGIQPGAGVGNRRCGLNKKTVGIPVIAVGVPTVVDAGTIVKTALENSGADSEAVSVPDMMVTPKDIDMIIEVTSDIVAQGINSGLHNFGN